MTKRVPLDLDAANAAEQVRRGWCGLAKSAEN
jgi:hypothetical protein